MFLYMFLSLIDTEPTRYEFMHISSSGKTLFYVLIYLSIFIMILQFFDRWRVWRKGKPIDWKPNIIRNFVENILLQKKVRSSRKKDAAPMHLMIFYGFATLFLATTLLAINTYGPWHFHKGIYYLGYEMVVDIMGLVYVIGVCWAIYRRVWARPKTLQHVVSDNWALLILLFLGLSGFILEAARMSNHPQYFDWSAPIGYGISKLLSHVSNEAYVLIWWIHAISVYVFFITLPRMKLKHIVMAVVSSTLKPNEKMGELKPIRMEDVEKTGKIGVTQMEDYSQWQLLSLDACMECGRCTEVCPAYLAGKELDPRKVVQGIRVYQNDDGAFVNSVGEDPLWSCTTCHACVEACPVLIRHVDLLVDMRRGEVAEGKLSGSGAVMLRQMGSTSNAWGASSETREDWMKNKEVPLAREKKEFDVLFWVGCAGATDPGAMKTTQAVSDLLQKAGVDYACLGKEESCTGDSARRVGDEFLYQQMVMQNMDVFKKYRFKKIITPCPHCFHTLKNEYNQFDKEADVEWNYQVEHHSQFIHELIEEGKLKPADKTGKKVVFHDPCYLSRVNNEFEAPRAVLNGDDNTPLLEPVNKKTKTLCCGAGGGRMWMEEEPDKRPGNRRSAELVQTGADHIAVGCPFCRIMVGDSVKQVTEKDISILDLAELVNESNKS